MSQVFVQTEKLYLESERRMAALFPFFPVNGNRKYYAITADELVDVLNSAAEHGPDQYYVLLDEK
jgi:hypothetical protein